MKPIVWFTLAAVGLGCVPVISAIPVNRDFAFASNANWKKLQFESQTTNYPYRPNYPFIGRYNGSRFFSGRADLASLMKGLRADLHGRPYKELHRKGTTIFRFGGEEVTMACIPQDPTWVTVTHDWNGTSGLLTR